jgi:hypothetical protein
MAIDHRVGSKVVKHLRREDAAATRVDPHPYIGIVKNNLDPTRAGRLQVWIPDLGGDPNNSSNWRTVSYASPFMGTTDIASKYADSPNSDNKFRNVPHTYGMWMVPPDIGVEVIVIFIAGDPLRGYFIACVNSHVSRHMMPGLASSNKIDPSGASDSTKKSYQPGITAPVAEYNEIDPIIKAKPNFIDNPKPIHEEQYSILKAQGLDRDTARGTITSSSQRESPSNVFGISTPGRPYDGDPADNVELYNARVLAGDFTEDDYRYTTRKGGHTFVMDDGNAIAENQLIRLRSAGGHQIMMNDSLNTLYISHRTGNSWVELSSDGQIHIFSKAGFNVRSEGSINLHSDTNINLNAANNINLNAGNKFQIDCASFNLLSAGVVTVGAGGTIGLQSSTEVNVDTGSISMNSTGDIAHTGELIKQNSGGAKTVKKPTAIPSRSFSDVALNSNGLYVPSGKLSSIVSVAPTHEPFNRSDKADESITTINTTLSNPTATNPAYKSLKGGTSTLTETDVRNQLLNGGVAGVIGPLSKDEVVALLAQIAKSESAAATPMNIDCKIPRAYSPRLQNGKAGYEAINQCGFLGKYQMGYAALQDAGFVASHCQGTATLGNPNMWLNGLTRDKFLASPALQEQAIFNFTKSNYDYLVGKRAITTATTNEEIAGLLMATHMLGKGDGVKFAASGSGEDRNNGTTGQSYYLKGKTAVATWGPKVQALRDG